ncbi:MAG: tyrosine-type recombinase/integrase, partial [Oscillospiraceae bacterium]|nr:tyrosine-type recombinase/integrase [Oscillospiraceae bacterium]
RQQDSGKCEYHITTPKTKTGIRIIPMLSEVKDALLEEYEKQSKSGFNKTVIDGYSGFIFKNRFGTVFSPHSINRVIASIIALHNELETEKAKAENREPELLPHFSVHNLRHTFCTRFCENETNIKVIQEIMGHADITTTMDIYNEATLDKKKESFANLEGKIKLS